MRTENNILIPENATDADLLQAAAVSRLPQLSVGHFGQPVHHVSASRVEACYNTDYPWRGGMAVYDTGIPNPAPQYFMGQQLDPEQGQLLHFTWHVCVDEYEPRIYVRLTPGLVGLEPEQLIGATIPGAEAGVLDSRHNCCIDIQLDA